MVFLVIYPESGRKNRPYQISKKPKKIKKTSFGSGIPGRLKN